MGVYQNIESTKSIAQTRQTIAQICIHIPILHPLDLNRLSISKRSTA
jgi:hypothetical protein